MVSNVPLGITCHFAIPGMGATLHMINTRLDASTVAFQVRTIIYNLFFGCFRLILLS